MPDFPLQFDSDLDITFGGRHQARLTSPSPDRLRLAFAERSAFRAFLKQFDAKPGELNRMQESLAELVDKTGVGIELYVNDREVVNYTAGQDPESRKLFLAVQYLRSFLD